MLPTFTPTNTDSCSQTAAKLVVPNYTWWDNYITYDPDNSLNSTLNIDSIQVYANGNYYNVPSKTYSMRPALKQPILSTERDYSIAVHIKNDGTAEYGAYLPWAERENQGPVYNSDGILIPVFDISNMIQTII